MVGPSYSSQSVNADAETCINWYPEQIESGAGNSPLALYPSPGTAVFANLGRTVTPAVDGIIGLDGTPETAAPVKSSAVSLPALTPSAGFTDFAIFAIWSYHNGVVPFTPGSGWATIDTGLYSQLASSSVTPNGTVVVSAEWAAVAALLKLEGSSAPAQIQGTTGTESGTYTATLNGVVAGNALIFYYEPIFSEASGTPAITITDNFGDTWTLIGSIGNPTGAPDSTDGPQTYLYAAFAVHGGNTTITVTPTVNTGQGPGTFGFFEYQGGAAPVTNSGPTRGCLTITGRTFFVCGTDFDEVFSNGTFTTWGEVANDSLPITMAASPQQLLVASAGTAYVFDLTANTLTPIAGATFSGPVAQAAICDDFFILTIKNTKEFYVSGVLNANDWVSNGAALVSVFPDNIVSMIVDHRQIWFYSDTKSVVYYDSGNLFPFDVIPGSFMEAGNAAEFSTQLFPNGVAWLGSDERGTGVVWLGPPGGGTPTRISNHALEFAIQGYTRIDNAVSITYQDQGHLFYQIYFPTPSVTWTYDVNTQMWHQRGYFVEAIGNFQAVHYWNHTFNFGKHLVGDWQSGNVYQLHIPVFTAGVWTFATDAGNPIVRIRRAPHVSNEQKRQFHAELQVYMETGLGPAVPLENPDGTFRGPTMDMRWSDDGGHSWSNYTTRDCGQIGDYSTRVRWLRLGRARDRVYEIRASDPIGYRIVDAYLRFAPGEDLER